MERHAILLVDDEPNILHSITRLLRKEGHKILSANSGREGLEILKRENVSLIISDQRMPEMNGVEFLHLVKEQYPETIRIILSGYTEVTTILSAINDGEVYKFVTKPWNDEEIKITIRRAIEQFELKAENKRLLDEIKRHSMDLEKKIEERTRDIVIRNKALTLAQAVLENLPVAVVGISFDGTISLVNRKGVEIFNSEPGSILGRKIEDVFPKEVTELVRHTIDAGIKEAFKDYKINSSAFDLECIPISVAPGTKGVTLVLIKSNDE